MDFELKGKVAVIQAKESKLNSAAFAKALAIYRQTGTYPPIQINGRSIGVQALRIAMTKIGDPYVWGGAGPNSFDCSGLVMWAYAQLGINVEVISPQNEPGYTGNYPTCGWSPANYTTFVGQYLGPALATAGLATKVMLGTFNGGDGDTTMVGNLMGDASARSYIRVLGYQWGMWRNIPRAKEYGLPIWQTEHQCGNYPWATPFDPSMAPNDQAYAVESAPVVLRTPGPGTTRYVPTLPVERA